MGNQKKDNKKHKLFHNISFYKLMNKFDNLINSMEGLTYPFYNIKRVGNTHPLNGNAIDSNNCA